MIAVVGVRAVVGGAIGLGLSLLVSAVVGKPVPLAVYAILIVGLGVRLGLAVAEWRTTTYRLSDTEFEYRSGYLSSSTLQVPWSSVRGLSVETPWLLRVFRRSELRIAHGAGQTDEVHLAALSPGAITELRSQIERARGTDGRGVDFFDDAAEFSRARIGLYALTHARWWVVIPLILAAVGLLSQFLGRDVVQTSLAVWDQLLRSPTETIVAVLSGTVLTALAVGFASRIVEMSNFRVRETQDRIESRQGMLTTRNRSIHRGDITVLDVRQPIVYRLAAGRSILRVSGGSGEGDPPHLLSPDASPGDVSSAIERIFPDHGQPALIARSRFVGILAVVLPWITVSLVVHTLIGAAWASALAGASIVAVLLWALRAPSRLSLSPDGVVEIRRGLAGRRRLILLASSILHFEVAAGPAGRRFPLNRVKLTIADRGTRDISIRALPHAEVSAARRALSERAELGSYRYRRHLDDADPATDEVDA